MDEKHIVADYMVRFTDESVAKLNLDRNITLRNFFTNACINFRHYSAASASKTLFNLFYGDSLSRYDIIDKLFKINPRIYDSSFFEQGPVFNIHDLTKEQLQVLIKEFLYQYSAAHPDFLVIESHPEYEKELNDLKTLMSNDPILLYKAVEMCKLVSQCHKDYVSTCFTRLMSTNTTYQMCGLKQIGYNFQNRILLLPYAREIGTLLMAIYNSKTANDIASPFREWLKQNDQPVVNELTQTLLLDELKKFINDKSEIIPILPHSIELCFALQRFDSLESLIDKKEFLLLTEAIISYYQAKQAYQDSQNFELSDFNSLCNVARTTKALEKSKENYEHAINIFLAFCSS